MVSLEQLLDKLADKLIVSTCVTPEIVRKNQKTIKNGVISFGRSQADKLLLYQRDVKANQQDIKASNVDDEGHSLQDIIDTWADFEIFQVEFTITGDPSACTISVLNTGDAVPHDLTNLLTNIDTTDDGYLIQNPLNVSQFIDIEQGSSYVDLEQAAEFLDTKIFELLGDETVRQERINAFFNEFQNLTNDAPDFYFDLDGFIGNEFSSNQYHWNNDITSPQEGDEQATVQESEGMITRLDFDDNTKNSGKTLESLRDTLNTYLADVDEVLPEFEDLRSTYQNKSGGYLKFRNLNQGIIIRNTNQEFIEGLNPDTLDYLRTGFTITMWVRFIDKTSEGTLFNFGNPLRETSPMGFMLDTYIINKDRESNVDKGIPLTNWDTTIGENNPNGELFLDSDSERFVRLLLIEEDKKLRDSHLGGANLTRPFGIPMQGFDNWNYATSEYDITLSPNQTNVQDTDYESNPTTGDNQFENSLGLFNHLKIPYNPTEWYFIVATYNPDIEEDTSYDVNVCGPSFNDACDMYPDYWRGNINSSDGSYTHYSGKGARCKVEIISKTDLLRARGYKV